MAVKKNALVKWDQEFAAHAKAAVEQEASIGGGGQSVKFGAGGTITVAGSQLPGNRLACVILGSCFENAWYDVPYDPDDPQPPTCWAFGEDPKEMAPHEECQQAQSEACAGCPKNEFGTASVGRGKECGNRKRLALITAKDAQDTELIGTVELALAKLPPTALKVWAGYVRALADEQGRPPWAVVTEIAGYPDSKSQYRLEFHLVEVIDNSDTLTALKARVGKVQEFLQRPYGPPVERDAKRKKSPVGKTKKFGAKKR
jgi:hypothetical protein